MYETPFRHLSDMQRDHCDVAEGYEQQSTREDSYTCTLSSTSLNSHEGVVRATCDFREVSAEFHAVGAAEQCYSNIPEHGGSETEGISARVERTARMHRMPMQTNWRIEKADFANALSRRLRVRAATGC